MYQRINPRPSAAKQDEREVSLTDIKIRSLDEKELPFEKIEVFTHVREDGSTTLGLVLDGTPALYWTHLYTEIGIDQPHASKIIRKLAYGKHYVSFDHSEIKAILDTNADLALLEKVNFLSKVKTYHFINEEGWHRAVQEIRTEYMKNPDAAKKIDALKDDMASVYTQYKHGALINPENTLSEPSADYYAKCEAKVKLYNLVRKVSIAQGADRRTANSVMIEMIKTEVPESYPFMAMIPEPEMDAPEDAVLTRRQVSQIINVSMPELEARLVKIGWIVRNAYGLIRTAKGSKYLRQDPHVGEKRVRYDVQFGLDAINLLKQEFEQQLLSAPIYGVI